MNIDPNKIYESRSYGKFRIIRDTGERKSGSRLVEIEFLETGAKAIVRYDCAVRGNVRDRYKKTMCGVACIGNASSYHQAYNMWESMIHRCYDKNYISYSRYGAKGVRVCDKWLCFEYFLEDLPLIDGYDNWIKNPTLYHIDKDYKQRGLGYECKIYSLETCCFLQASDNIAVARMDSNIRRNSNCKYVGVRQTSNESYNAYIYIDKTYHNLGTFQTPELAAAAYNNACSYFYSNRQVMNDVPYIYPSELILLNKCAKPMCKII